MSLQPAGSFKCPRAYGYPPMWTIQRNLATRKSQYMRWSAFILAYCQYHRLWRLTIIDALDSHLFRNDHLRKGLSFQEATGIIDWMTQEDGMRRAEWTGKEGERGSAWIYWRRPEEWADVIAAWVDETGQKNTVLTLYELSQGESSVSQGKASTGHGPAEADTFADFHGMDPEILQRSLRVLVKCGKAHVFGSEDQQGVKFF